MKKVLILIFLIQPLSLRSQIITTIAGGGVSFADNIPASASKLVNVGYFGIDKQGNLYFSDGSSHKIRKIDIFGNISTVAGTGGSGFSGDGDIAVNAKLNQPAGLAIDTLGNIFFADNANNRIRKININTGLISTIAGSVAGYSGDGTFANAAQLRLPGGLCFDKLGNLFIGDCGNLRVRKINTAGVISTIAGNGLTGWGGDGGPAILARCAPWGGMCADSSGNVYVSEWSLGTVRKITTDGQITTVAGDTTTPHYFNGDGLPATNARIDPFYVAIDKNGNLFLSDTYNNRIRKVGNDGIIQTIAGTGIAGNDGDNGPALNAKIHRPSGLIFDSCGNLFLGQIGTPRIRKIEFNPLCTSVADVEKTALFSHDFSVFPNPTTTTLTLSSPCDMVTIAISNLVGEIVYTAKFTGTRRAELPTGHLPPGMYLIRVNERWVQRFMKE